MEMVAAVEWWLMWWWIMVADGGVRMIVSGKCWRRGIVVTVIGGG